MAIHMGDDGVEFIVLKPGERVSLREAMETMNSLPKIDIVSVVRCKDCKHRPTDNTNEKSCGGFDIEFPDAVCPCQCDDGYYSFYPEDDWFCADGERRDDDAFSGR